MKFLIFLSATAFEVCSSSIKWTSKRFWVNGASTLNQKLNSCFAVWTVGCRSSDTLMGSYMGTEWSEVQKLEAPFGTVELSYRNLF